ncbi:MAG: hypothetical protein IJJ26_12190 [Victivallales bacterium]|nr:hypothetical protein [Victivallales bacterium]
MNAEWVYAAVTGFGRHFGFERFALNDKGVAAATFENGTSLALEYSNDVLCLQVRTPINPEQATLKKLLVTSHPRNRFPFVLRTAFLPKTSQGLFLVKMNERDVTENSLWQMFSNIWNVMQSFGGTRWS